VKRGALSVISAEVQRLTLLLWLLLVALVVRTGLLLGVLALLRFLLAALAVIVVLTALLGTTGIVDVCLLAAISGVFRLFVVAGGIGHDGFPLLLRFKCAKSGAVPDRAANRALNQRECSAAVPAD
jgi:hypothetical protein